MTALEPRPQLLALALCIGLLAAPAQACGPDFPHRLLGDRATTLAELPEQNFAYEASRLGERIAGLPDAGEATLTPYWWDEDGNQAYAQQRADAEQAGLSPEQQATLQRLRGLADAGQAELQGATDLPLELALYTAGAVAFAQHDLALAADYFRRVLALPADERRQRSTWAAYSLGRTLARQVGNDMDAPEAVYAAHLQEAKEAFQRTRQLVIEGFPDPLELGVASLGEEARLYLPDGDWADAIRLYASQARHGSSSGHNSLKSLARTLTQMPEEQLLKLLPQREVQQLLTVHLLSRIAWSYGEQPAGEARLAELLQRNLAGDLENADRLAALSYQYGHYDQAAGFLEHAGDSGLAWWLRAKLALRAGDKEHARQAYAKAAKAFPRDESWGYRRAADWSWESLKPACRVEGESALLALERGDYVEAFDQLYRSGDIYWLDAAEVAERVLTLDELKRYVDAQVPAPPPQTAEDRENYRPLPIATQLRELLGRRLLREERYAEALAYFASEQRRSAARAYGEAREAAQRRWTDIGRAQAYYQAALLAREQGLELLGYEMSPDYAIYGGSFALEHLPQQAPAGLLSEAEAQRQNRHLAEPNQRFHYRYVAADLANRSADLLPPRSQAFAATLCKATGWLLRSDPQAAQPYYRRYVAEGPYVPWAWDFGRQCEEPDFERASEHLWQQRELSVRRTLRPYKPWLLAGSALAALAGLAYWCRQRGQRRL